MENTQDRIRIVPVYHENRMENTQYRIRIVPVYHEFRIDLESAIYTQGSSRSSHIILVPSQNRLFGFQYRGTDIWCHRFKVN